MPLIAAALAVAEEPASAPWGGPALDERQADLPEETVPEPEVAREPPGRLQAVDP